VNANTIAGILNIITALVLALILILDTGWRQTHKGTAIFFIVLILGNLIFAFGNLVVVPRAK
jgi:Zn-dependent protease